MESNQGILGFEDYLCKKRGNIKELPTVWENRNMILYIVHEVLGLTEEEFVSLYSTNTNNRFRLQKYISSIVSIQQRQGKLDAFFCEKSKEQIISVLYPRRAVDKKLDMIHKLNNNNERVIQWLSRIKDDKQRDVVMLHYLRWLLKNVFGLQTRKEIYEFLLKAEQLKLKEYVPALAIIYQDYCCLMDFHFLTLSDEDKQKDVKLYVRYRKEIPKHLDVLVTLGFLRKRIGPKTNIST